MDIIGDHCQHIAEVITQLVLLLAEASLSVEPSPLYILPID